MSVPWSETTHLFLRFGKRDARVCTKSCVICQSSFTSGGLDKRDEFVSDEEALRLMPRAGYDPMHFGGDAEAGIHPGFKRSRLALLLQNPSKSHRQTGSNGQDLPAHAGDATVACAFGSAL